MDVISAALAKHAPVLAGLAMGTLAKFGRMIAINQPVTWRQVIGHMMMMGVCGLIATLLTDATGIADPNARAFAAAVLAIAASDVIQWAATRAWKRVLLDNAAALDGVIEKQQTVRGEIRQNLQVVQSAQETLGDKAGIDAAIERLPE